MVRINNILNFFIIYIYIYNIFIKSRKNYFPYLNKILFFWISKFILKNCFQRCSQTCPYIFLHNVYYFNYERFKSKINSQKRHVGKKEKE